MIIFKEISKSGEKQCDFHKNWEDLKGMPKIVKLIKFGHRINFGKGPMVIEPWKEYWTRPHGNQKEVVNNSIKDLMRKRVI